MKARLLLAIFVACPGWAQLPADAQADVGALIRQLSSPDSGVRGGTIARLGALGSDAAAAVPALVALLDDDAAYLDSDMNGHLFDSIPADGAAEALASIGRPAVPGLIEALERGRGDARARAAFALGRIDDPRRIEPLIAALGDRNGDVRAAAAEALPYGEPRTLEPFVAALRDRDVRVRSAATDRLANIGDARAVPPLVRALHREEDVDAACDMLQALANIGDARAVPAIAATLADVERDPLVREWAARSIAEFTHDPQAFDALFAAARGADADVRYVATSSIGALDDRRATPFLLEALASTDWRARFAAAWAFGDLADPAAVDALIAALREEDSPRTMEAALLRQAAAKALGAIGDPRAFAPLVAALGDWSGNVGGASAEALGKLGDVRALEPLLAALAGRDTLLREGAATGLGVLGDPRAVEGLTAALADSSHRVQERAAQALAAIDAAR